MKKQIVYIGIGVCVVAALGALSVYFALSGGGEINVNDRIRATDQSGFEHAVLENTRAEVPNGGLRPQGGVPTPQAPTQPTPEPSLEASSTEATSTPQEAQSQATSSPEATQ